MSCMGERQLNAAVPDELHAKLSDLHNLTSWEIKVMVAAAIRGFVKASEAKQFQMVLAVCREYHLNDEPQSPEQIIDQISAETDAVDASVAMLDRDEPEQ